MAIVTGQVAAQRRHEDGVVQFAPTGAAPRPTIGEGSVRRVALALVAMPAVQQERPIQVGHGVARIAPEECLVRGEEPPGVVGEEQLARG